MIKILKKAKQIFIFYDYLLINVVYTDSYE